MPTLKELWDKITGMEADVTALKTKTPSSDPVALAGEIQARVKLENDFTALKGQLTAALAAVPPPKKEGEGDDNPHAAAIEALEKAITVLKATSPAPEKDDKDTEGDAKAEDDADAADDAEAKECMAKKNFLQVLAVRNRQFARKGAYVPKMVAKVKAITLKKDVTAEIAKLGIQLPLAMRKDGKSPLLAEKSSRQRAHKLTASGFNEQPSVAALNQSLGRVVRN